MKQRTKALLAGVISGAAFAGLVGGLILWLPSYKQKKEVEAIKPVETAAPIIKEPPAGNVSRQTGWTRRASGRSTAPIWRRELRSGLNMRTLSPATRILRVGSKSRVWTLTCRSCKRQIITFTYTMIWIAPMISAACPLQILSAT